MIVLTRRMRFFALLLISVIAVALVWRKIAMRPTVGRLADGSKLQLVGFQVGSKFESWHRPSLQEKFEAFVHFRPQPEPGLSMSRFGQSVGRLFLTLHDAKT